MYLQGHHAQSMSHPHRAPRRSGIAAADDEGFRRLNEIRSRRSQIVAKAGQECGAAVEDALGVESDLVYMLDRVQFAEDQLKILPTSNKVVEQLADRARSVEAAWAPHLSDLDRLDRCRELSAIIAARIHAVQVALELCGDATGNVGGPTLTTLLQRLEQELLGTGGGAHSVVPSTDLQKLNALGILARAPIPSSSSISALPDGHHEIGKAEPARHAPYPAADEFSLQRQVEDLTDRNEHLRARLKSFGNIKGEGNASGHGGDRISDEALQRLECENRELDAEVQRLEEELTPLLEDNSNLQSQIDHTRTEITGYENQVAQRRASNSGLEQRLHVQRRTGQCPPASSEQLVAALRLELAEAYEQFATLGDGQALEDEVVRLRTECANLEAEKACPRPKAQPSQVQTKQELITCLARQRKEIADLKERVRREELRSGLWRAWGDEVGSRVASKPYDGHSTGVGAPAAQAVPLGNALTAAALGNIVRTADGAPMQTRSSSKPSTPSAVDPVNMVRRRFSQ